MRIERKSLERVDKITVTSVSWRIIDEIRLSVVQCTLEMLRCGMMSFSCAMQVAMH